jgi:hypothetical protein
MGKYTRNCRSLSDTDCFNCGRKCERVYYQYNLNLLKHMKFKQLKPLVSLKSKESVGPSECAGILGKCEKEEC